MNPIDELVEARIQEAMDRGEFENLPGQGKPLNLEDEAQVPEELRAGYRLLKNSGYLPPELEVRREIANVESLLAQAQEPGERARLSRRLDYLLLRMNLCGGGSRHLRLEQDYYDKIVERLNRPKARIRDG